MDLEHFFPSTQRWEFIKENQESDQENKRENKNSTKKAIKKTRKQERKQELDQESDQEKKKKKLSFFLYHFLGRDLVFFYKFPPQGTRTATIINRVCKKDAQDTTSYFSSPIKILKKTWIFRRFPIESFKRTRRNLLWKFITHFQDSEATYSMKRNDNYHPDHWI